MTRRTLQLLGPWTMSVTPLKLMELPSGWRQHLGIQIPPNEQFDPDSRLGGLLPSQREGIARILQSLSPPERRAFHLASAHALHQHLSSYTGCEPDTADLRAILAVTSGSPATPSVGPVLIVFKQPQVCHGGRDCDDDAQPSSFLQTVPGATMSWRECRILFGGFITTCKKPDSSYDPTCHTLSSMPTASTADAERQGEDALAAQARHVPDPVQGHCAGSPEAEVPHARSSAYETDLVLQSRPRNLCLTPGGSLTTV